MCSKNVFSGLVLSQAQGARKCQGSACLFLVHVPGHCSRLRLRCVSLGLLSQSGDCSSVPPRLNCCAFVSTAPHKRCSPGRQRRFTVAFPSRPPSGGAKSKLATRPVGNGASVLRSSLRTPSGGSRSKLASRQVGSGALALRSSLLAPVGGARSKLASHPGDDNGSVALQSASHAPGGGAK